jgi:hypothetical protein
MPGIGLLTLVAKTKNLNFEPKIRSPVRPRRQFFASFPRNAGKD